MFSEKFLFALYFVVIFSSPPFVSADADPQNDACSQARDKGGSECGAQGGRRFYFDANTRRCQPFIYEGCGGNGNKFDSLDQCKKQCGNFVPAEKAGGHGMVLPVPKCDGGVRAAVDPEARVLNCPGDKCPDGYECKGGNCCPSNKDTVCNVEYDTGRYAFQGSHTPRYFFKKDVNNCLLFTYYGALGNANNFETYNDCIKYCKKSS